MRGITEETLSDLRQRDFKGVFESHVERVVDQDAALLRAQHNASRARLLTGTGGGGRGEVLLGVECELAGLVLGRFVVLFGLVQHGLHERLVFLAATYADRCFVDLNHALRAKAIRTIFLRFLFDYPLCRSVNPLFCHLDSRFTSTNNRRTKAWYCSVFLVIEDNWLLALVTAA